MKISAQQVKELRDRTGAGMMDCKKALTETDGNVENAIDLLRKTGMAKAAKKASRTANEGAVISYIHPGNKIGVLCEVNCETDFVAKNEDFINFIKDVCMHIAAANPIAVDRDGIDPKTIEREKEIYREQGKTEGKPENIVEKIMIGRVEKYYAENCLLEQNFVKDTTKTIKELLTETIATMGENISIAKFTRYQIGK